MAGEGQILRHAREQNGWTLLNAEEATKIRIRYLEALEAEDYAVLPGATYAKGFLRTYAKNLGLNPDEILALYKSSAPMESAPTLNPPLTPMRNRPLWLRPAAAILMALLAIAVAIGISYFSRSPKEPAASGYNPAPVPSAPPADTGIQQNQGGTGASQAGATGDQTGGTTPPANGGQAVPSPAGTTPAGTANNVPAVPADGLVAQLVFTEKCWLVVAADGQTVLNGNYFPGDTKVIEAKTRIDLVTVGNAGGVSITLNGRPMPSLGKMWQVVNNVRYTKDSLK